MCQKQKKSSPKPPPLQPQPDPKDVELETFLKEIEIDDEGDRKPAASDSWGISAGGEGKESNEDSLFKGNIEDEKMDTKDEKGDDEEGPSKKQ